MTGTIDRDMHETHNQREELLQDAVYFLERQYLKKRKALGEAQSLLLSLNRLMVSMSVKDTLLTLLSLLKRVVDFEAAGVFVKNLDGEFELCVATQHDSFENELPYGQLIERLQKKEIVVFNDLSKTAAMTGIKYDGVVSWGSALMFLLQKGGREVVILLTCVKRASFRKECIHTFMLFEPLIIHAIEKSYEQESFKGLAEQLDNLAYNDSLTGLHNKTFLDRELNRILPDCSFGDGLLLFLVDIDRFKKVNDDVGYAAGDQALKIIAQRLFSLLGSKGKVFRIGGNQFAVLMSESALESGNPYAESILNIFNEPVALSQKIMLLQASVGFVHFPTDADSALGLMEYAKLSLFEAKDSGRNRFCRIGRMTP